MTGKPVKLYNAIFPLWLLLWFYVPLWGVALPANFLIDLLVAAITMKCLKIPNVWQNAKACIVKIWLLGFAADFIGSGMMLLPSFAGNLFEYSSPFGKWWSDVMVNAVILRPSDSMISLLWVTLSVLAAAISIFLFNYKISLKKLPLSQPERRKLALSLAIFTAPYLFYLPTPGY